MPVLSESEVWELTVIVNELVLLFTLAQVTPEVTVHVTLLVTLIEEEVPPAEVGL